MPYLSKLTKRLALGLALFLLASACTDAAGDLATDPLSTFPDTDADARTPVSSVVVSPSTSSLEVGAWVDLDAKTLSSRGRLLTNRKVSWTSSDSLVARVDSRGVVTGRAGGNAMITATSEGEAGYANVIILGGASAPPATVTDLRLVSAASSSLTIAFTEVDDGTGAPSNYSLIIGSPAVLYVGDPTIGTELLGTGIGATRTHTINGLTPGTTYQVVVVSLRGRLTATTVVGAPSSALTAATVASTVSAAAPFFSDGFEAAARTNANGFLWKSANSGVSVSGSRAYSGGYSLEFRYGPDLPAEDSSAEQRFDLGRDIGEVWVEYMLFVPANFVHRAESPSNNKFFMIWNTTYGSGSETWQAGYEYLRAGDYQSSLRPMSSKEFGNLATYVTSSELAHPDNGRSFIGAADPLKPGTWSRVRMQYARSTASGATDGIMRLWLNGELIAEMTNGAFRNLNDVGETVLRNGYFMGWANSGFTQDTRFYIDDVKFYSANPGW